MEYVLYWVIMDQKELKEIIERAWDAVKKREEWVIKNINVSEWAISASLYCELRCDNRLKEWDIHAEYNKQGTDEKQKKMSDDKPIRPDIVIHRAGKTDKCDNLLYIEVKKEKVKKEKGDENIYPEDIEKCEDVTDVPGGERSFQYQYALLLAYNKEEGDATIRWFKNGKEIEN